MGNRAVNALAHFWVTSEIDDTVRRIALAEDRSVSSVYRELVEKGLAAAGYRAGEKDLSAMIRIAVNESIKPHIERLAAISAKGVQIDAASYFLQVYNGKQAMPDYLQEEYAGIAANARKLGIEYLKLPKEKDIDEFISRGFQRMEEDSQ